MTHETAAALDAMAAGLAARAALAEHGAAPRFRYDVRCVGADGTERWAEAFDNLVTDQGANFLLEVGFGATAKPANWFLGLIGSGTPVAGDTYATHAGFTESTAYSNANRPTLAFAAASGRSKATSAAASFTINATATITGAFTATAATKGDTAAAGAVLYSAGLFSVARSVLSGDTLAVTLTLSA